jgi:hypothetical protein
MQKDSTAYGVTVSFGSRVSTLAGPSASFRLRTLRRDKQGGQAGGKEFSNQ